MAYFSNGSEGEAYIDEYCSRCIHFQDAERNIACPIWYLHMVHNYDECNKPDSFLHVLIPRSKGGLSNEQCKMFAPAPSMGLDL
jgi:hypothetical protein